MVDQSKRHAYENMDTTASLEAIRLSLLKSKIESEEKLMKALSTYYAEQADIEFRNERFGFDLDLR
jgi:hypothetical protein